MIILIKILLVVLLCIPVIYLSIRFGSRLIGEVQEQEIKSERMKRIRKQDNSEQEYDYNFKYMGEIDSKRYRGTTNPNKKNNKNIKGKKGASAR